MAMQFGSATPDTHQIGFGASMPGERNRLTAAIRLIMVIPQYIALFFIGIAAYIVVIIGWFAALITGQLPPFAREFLTGVLRWSYRVEAYFYFLTDEYPPFTLAAEEAYPVTLSFPEPVELNRLSVLFRLILAIPAAVVAGVAQAGCGVLSVASWFMILFTGAMPAGIYEATRAVLRFEARFAGWFIMLTPDYPWGLWGDGGVSYGGGAPAQPAPALAERPDPRAPLVLSVVGARVMTVLVVLGALAVLYRLVIH